MAGQDSSSANNAPYIPFTTFRNTLTKWGETGALPSRIDNSLLSTMSGGAQSQFLGALRFFELIDDGGAPSDALRLLVSQGKDFGKNLKPLLLRFYTEDQLRQLEHGTPASLAESFPGRSSSVTQKMCRFFITAAEEGQLSISPHLKDSHGRVKGASKKNGRHRKRNVAPPPADPPEEPRRPQPEPPGVSSWHLELTNGRSAELRWPSDADQDDIEAMWSQLEPLRAVLEARARTRARSAEPRSGD